MMTLKEAIKHCKDVALSCTNKECALEHFQLLKWLQEYSNMLEKQGEQPTAWSEEDEMQLDAAIHLVSNTGHIETANWLKSLRPQNNITDEELSQAKKDAYNDALDKIEYHSGEPTFDDGWSAAIDYIRKKYLTPQNTWKPSDEQIKALNYVVNLMASSERPTENDLYYNILKSLRQQLKKLMEE